jgi:hypothetical protein
MFHFVANLKPYTLPEASTEVRFDAYLLSADYASGLAKLAAVVRAEQRVLVADNGNMDVMRGLGKEFAAEAAAIDVDRRAWEQSHGRYARPAELPEELRARFRGLAQKMAARSEAVTTDDFARTAVSRQSSIDPALFVGMEDLTIATMGGLNLEPEYVDLPDGFFEERVRRAVRFARRTIDGEFGEVRGKVLAGLHALDYDTGVLAGRVAAEAGIEGVTLGMFGALTDRNYVDFRVEDGKIIDLAATVPRPYLRVIEIAAGVVEGFRREGRPRPAFHGLGVGTPILLPLLSLLGHGEQYFATDSTAPIVDGWSSPTISLYVIDPAPLKYKAYRVADEWIRGGRGWECECPYCLRFHEAHPPDLHRARQWWQEQGKPEIKKEMLERNGPLTEWLPFLGYSPDASLRTRAAMARVGHNHWVLRQLELEIRTHSTNWTDLQAWVGGIVNAYRTAPGPEEWKVAVTEAYSLARTVGERLAAAATRELPGDTQSLIAPEKVDDEEGQASQPQDQVDRHRAPHLAQPAMLPGAPVGILPVVLLHDSNVAGADTLVNPASGSDGLGSATPQAPLLGDDIRPEEGGVHQDQPQDQSDRDRAIHEPQPGAAPPAPPLFRWGVFRRHHSNVAEAGTLVKPLGIGRSIGDHGGMPVEFLSGYGEPMTEHPPSRLLLLATIEKLRETEGITRVWDKLQPLGSELAGFAVQLLDALRSNTIAVESRLEPLGQVVDAWRAVLTDMAASNSEEATQWREALLSAATQTFGADGEARTAALLQGKAPLLRVVQASRQAAEEAQSAFILAIAAAHATAFRLSGLAAYLAAASKDDNEQPAVLDGAMLDWLTSFVDQTEAFVTGGFVQFHGLFASDDPSLDDARMLALVVLDQVGSHALTIAQVLGSISSSGVSPELLPQFGPVVVRLSELDARLSLLVAYSAHVAGHSHSLAAEAWLTSERTFAKLDFPSDVPTGVNVEIDTLGDHEINALVELHGRVETLAIGNDPAPPKFSTFLQFRSFDGGAVVRLRAHMFNLQKNGLCEGALCKIRGFVRREQPWLGENETGLDIDRVSLSKLRKTSWLDSVTYRMRPFFRLYQDEMNLFNTPGGV